MNKTLLTEGGVAGHLAHLYDNRGLTYNKIAKILSMASNGELQGTEKTDGFNIYLGFNGGVPKFARNKGDMQVGGRDLQFLQAREFAGGEGVKKVYLDAFDSWSMALAALSPEEKRQIFGENGEIFYNTEIMGPGATNVINYDINVMTIHRGGHKIYNTETDRVEGTDAADGAAVLDAALDRVEQEVEGRRFSIQRTAVVKLKALDTDHDLDITLQRIQKAGLVPGMTIEEYLEQRLLQSSFLEHYDPAIRQDVIDRILKKTGPGGEKVYKDLSSIYSGYSLQKPQRAEIKDFVNKSAAIISQAIFPIEDAIHDFAVEMLKGLESTYILDNAKELGRLKGEVKKAVKAIQSYTGPGREEAQSVLLKQLSKIKHLDNISAPAEGFVFEFEGQMYKFTGNFAPVNQILGLFRYGRGSVPAISAGEEAPAHRDDAAEATSPALDFSQYDSIALIPGGFKPPHRGHLDLVKNAANLADMVFVFTGTKPRAMGDKQVTLELSQQIWGLYLEDAGIADSVTFIPVEGNPMKVAYQVLEHETVPGQTVAMAASSKDAGRFTSEIQDKYAPEGGTVEPLVVGATKHSVSGEELSATFMREFIKSGNFEEFKEYIPLASQDRAAEIWGLLGGHYSAVNPISETIINLVEEVMDEMYTTGMRSYKHNGIDMRTADNRKKNEAGALCGQDPDCDPEEMRRLVKPDENLEEISSVGGGAVEVGTYAAPASIPGGRRDAECDENDPACEEDKRTRSTDGLIGNGPSTVENLEENILNYIIRMG